MFDVSGIDFHDLANLGAKVAEHEDVARKSKVISSTIRAYQDSLSAVEKVCSVSFQFRRRSLTEPNIVLYKKDVLF